MKEASDIKLVVGLGNPGKDYERTRHNVGFWCIERLQDSLNASRPYKKWQAFVSEAKVAQERVYLLRPQTYMNLSGQSVKEAILALDIDPSRELILVYDDLDLPVGSIRLREKGSAGGHNGVKSVLQLAGSTEFARIRIGIGRPPYDVTVIDYVLGSFSKHDREQVLRAVDVAAKAVREACEEPFPVVMNKFNSRPSIS